MNFAHMLIWKCGGGHLGPVPRKWIAILTEKSTKFSGPKPIPLQNKGLLSPPGTCDIL